MTCSTCRDRGYYYEDFEYPWGGYDSLIVFCTCDNGIKEEKDMWEAYNAHRPVYIVKPPTSS